MSRLALLFDLDGTLVDTDRLHLAAFSAILAEEGRALTMDEYKTHVMGHPNNAIAARYFGTDRDRGITLLSRKEEMFRASLADSVEPVAGIHDLLDWAGRNDAGTAVVTNAPRENARAMLAAAGLDGRLATLVIGDELPRAKPDPLPYLTAMRLLGATPSRATAFEDSRSGLRAARASGAHVFGLTTGLPPEALTEAGAHIAIPDFTAPALWAHLNERKAA